MPQLPGISVVMPIRNEQRHLPAAVTGVLSQDYPGPMQVIMAIGPSTDATAQIAQQLRRDNNRADRELILLDNPSGATPAGLNLAISAARYDIIVRVDGHGELSPGYLQQAVALLLETGAANVGGVMEARGETAFEQAVAHAYTSKLGIGGASFHQGSAAAGPADTVFLGVFRKERLLAAGGFDETLLRAQDWELNYRLRRRGEVIWFSPKLRVTYRPRSSLRALARQFFATGRWRREIVRRHPETVNPRYLAPPVALIGIVGGTSAGAIGLASGLGWLVWGFAAPIGYAVLLVAGTAAARDLPWGVRVRLPGVYATMHLSWGLGFLLGRPKG